MSFDNKSTEELIRLAKAGLGFKLNPANKETADLNRIIDAAQEGGATISMTGIAETDHESDSILEPDL